MGLRQSPDHRLQRHALVAWQKRPDYDSAPFTLPPSPHTPAPGMGLPERPYHLLQRHALVVRQDRPDDGRRNAEPQQHLVECPAVLLCPGPEEQYDSALGQASPGLNGAVFF